MAKANPSDIRIELTKELSIPAPEGPETPPVATPGLLSPPRPQEAQYDKDNEPPPMQTRLVRASRQGDSIRVAKLLDSNPDIDVTSTDALGRSALRMAVKMDHLEVVETLISRANPSRVIEALLLSIALGHDQISEAIIQHRVYKRCKQMMKVCSLSKNSRMVESVLEHTIDGTLFSSDITPLILAAQKDQYEIVRLLLSKGEIIREPCPLECECLSCLSSKQDELRYAATRLNTYKALASEAYISLQSPDPLLRAWELAHKLRKRSKHEGYFRLQYLLLADSLSKYSVKLLDKVRDVRELEDILDDENGELSRLGLAVQYREKQFVAHPSCQKKLMSVWLGQVNFLHQLNSFWRMFVFAVSLTVCYPFLAVCYLIYPWNKIGRFLTVPAVKCTSMACSYIVFVLMAVVYSQMERPFLQAEGTSGGVRLTDLTYLRNGSVTLAEPFTDYLQSCRGANTTLIKDVYIRNDRLGYGTWVMILWVTGLIWQSCQRLYHDELRHFLSSWYNRADFFMYMFFASAFTLRIIGLTKTSKAIALIREENTWQELLSIGCVQNSSQIKSRYSEALYLINADRRAWDTWDLYIVFEALHALGNILAVCRLSFIFALHPHIGPLMRSLSSMIRDVFQFMFVFALVVFGFFLAFHTLFWYHSPHNQLSSGTLRHGEDGQSETGLYASDTFDSILWSIFGMVDKGDVKFLQKETIPSDVTRILGAILFGLYNWITVIVLITMLIAMMARSYDSIADDADVQWKFSRSSLYMDFIKPGFTLCVPFNLVPCTKSVIYLIQWLMNLVRKGRPSTTFKDRWRKRLDSPVCESPDPMDPSQSNGGVFQLTLPADSPSAGQQPNHTVQTPYEFTMKCILERCIAQATNKTEGRANKDKEKGSETDLISKEISSLRTEISNGAKLQEERIGHLEKKLSEVDTTLLKLIGKGFLPVNRPTATTDEKTPPLRLAPLLECSTEPDLQKQWSPAEIESVTQNLADLKGMMRKILRDSASATERETGSDTRGVLDREHSIDLALPSEHHQESTA